MQWPHLQTSLLYTLLLATSLPLSTLAIPAPASPRPSIRPRTCGTENPSPELRQAHLSASSREARLTTRQQSNVIYIPTYFHIVESHSKINSVTQKMIFDQWNFLNLTYANSLIQYVVKGIDYSINDTWATGSDDQNMKTRLRKGTYSTLNIYFQTDLTSPNTPAGELLLGVCTLPSSGVTSSTPVSEYILDGCNVLAATMSGGSLSGYNMGGTAVHEVGHWNGLLHPFQDNTCASGDQGDYISDTPQESMATSGCPAGKDSCPSSPGTDPIHNFMDYSDDACYVSFTAGQTARMQSMWGTMRQGR